MPQKQHSLHANHARRFACLLIASLLLNACQTAPTSAPSVTLTSPAPSSSTQIALPTQPPLTSTAVVSATPDPSATAENTQTSTPPVTITAIGDLVSVPAGNVIMPILMYHHISDVTGSRYTTPIKVFREQMDTLKKEGYQTVNISQLTDVIRSGGELPEKPVAITFDDGYLDTYENAYPILRELGYTATVYIITSTLGTDLSYGYMQEDTLKELIGAGWEIGSHGVTHTDLTKTKLGAGNEMKQSKEDLETKLGIKVRSFSYPFAVTNQELKDLAADTGYESGVGIDILNTHTPKRLYFLSRREIYRSLPLFTFVKVIVPSKDDDLIATQSAVTETPAP